MQTLSCLLHTSQDPLSFQSILSVFPNPLCIASDFSQLAGQGGRASHPVKMTLCRSDPDRNGESDQSQMVLVEGQVWLQDGKVQLCYFGSRSPALGIEQRKRRRGIGRWRVK